ncbi:MAG: thermonuclease family protein [Candidatus Omnitrophica bacterium]|nr:thermonuclease family protein [Candidatus Omnitrophota bacterium]
MRLGILFFLGFFVLIAGTHATARDGIDDLLHFSSKQEQALVVKVANSNVIVLENGRRVRLIGIESAGLPLRKTVDLDKNGKAIEHREDVAIPLEEQAITYAQDLLEDKKVKLEYDVQSMDDDGKYQAYVFLPDGRMANVELLRQGFVYLKIRPPNIKYAGQLRLAYQEAKREQRGFLSN